jgi:hypothetical protein
MDNYIHGEKLGPRVVEVLALENYKLLLTFNNKEKRIFDASKLLGFKAFKPLNNIEFFKSVSVKYGTVAWANDIDYCPDTLYAESSPYTEVQ